MKLQTRVVAPVRDPIIDPVRELVTDAMRNPVLDPVRKLVGVRELPQRFGSSWVRKLSWK